MVKTNPFWTPVKKQNLKVPSMFTIKPLKTKHASIHPVNLKLYPTRTKSEIRLIDKKPLGDKDRDKVINFFDCKPMNRKKQDFQPWRKSADRKPEKLRKRAQLRNVREGPVMRKIEKIKPILNDEKFNKNTQEWVESHLIEEIDFKPSKDFYAPIKVEKAPPVIKQRAILIKKKSVSADDYNREDIGFEDENLTDDENEEIYNKKEKKVVTNKLQQKEKEKEKLFARFMKTATPEEIERWREERYSKTLPDLPKSRRMRAVEKKIEKERKKDKEALERWYAETYGDISQKKMGLFEDKRAKWTPFGWQATKEEKREAYKKLRESGANVEMAQKISPYRPSIIKRIIESKPKHYVYKEYNDAEKKRLKETGFKTPEWRREAVRKSHAKKARLEPLRKMEEEQLISSIMKYNNPQKEKIIEQLEKPSVMKKMKELGISTKIKKEISDFNKGKKNILKREKWDKRAGIFSSDKKYVKKILAGGVSEEEAFNMFKKLPLEEKKKILLDIEVINRTDRLEHLKEQAIKIKNIDVLKKVEGFKGMKRNYVLDNLRNMKNEGIKEIRNEIEIHEEALSDLPYEEKEISDYTAQNLIDTSEKDLKKKKREEEDSVMEMALPDGSFEKLESDRKRWDDITEPESESEPSAQELIDEA